MFIYELPKGSSITIRSSLGLTFTEHRTKIADVDPENGFILVDVLKHDDKIIGFQAKNVINVVTAVSADDSKVYIYHNTVIDAVCRKKKEKQIFHRIRTTEDVPSSNRRNSFRLYLGFDGILRTGDNKRTHEIVVKDISTSGFSFFAKMDAKLQPGQSIHLVFSDPENHARFSLNGEIIHAISVDASTMLFGCKLPAENNAIGRYMAEKQRKYCRNHA